MIYVNVLQAEGTMELDLWMNSASPAARERKNPRHRREPRNIHEAPAASAATRLDSGTHRSPGGYHDWARLYMDRSHFHQFVQAYIHESGIHFAKPTQPFISFQSNAAAGVFGSDVSPPVAPSGASA